MRIRLDNLVKALSYLLSQDQQIVNKCLGDKVMKSELVFKTDTLELTKQRDGYWLWDSTREMNLSMRAADERVTLINAIEYYQKALLEIKTNVGNSPNG